MAIEQENASDNPYSAPLEQCDPTAKSALEKFLDILTSIAVAIAGGIVAAALLGIVVAALLIWLAWWRWWIGD